MSNEYHTQMADGSIIDTRTGDVIKPAPNQSIVPEQPVSPKPEQTPVFTNIDSETTLNVSPTTSQMESAGLGIEEKKNYRWTGKTYEHVDDIDWKHFINPKTNRPFEDPLSIGKYGPIDRQEQLTNVIAPVVDPLNAFMDVLKPKDSILDVASDMFVDGSVTALKFGYNKLIPQKVKDVGGWAIDKYDDAMLGFSQKLNIAPVYTHTVAAALEAGGPSIASKIKKGGPPLIKQLLQKPNKLALATTGSTVGSDIFTQGSKSDNLYKSFFAYSDGVKAFPDSQFTKIPKPLVADVPKWKEVLSRARGTGDKMRNAVAAIFGDGIITNYQKASRYPALRKGVEKLGQIANVHHVGFLEKLKHGILNHSSFKLMEKAAAQGKIMTSPVVAELTKLKIKLGNFDQNVADVFSVMTEPFRKQRIANVMEALDGKLDKTTVNQLLGKTGLKDKTLISSQYPDLASWKKRFPNKPYPGFDDPKLIGKDIFPEYTLKDGSTWQPQNWDQYTDRFKIHLEKEGIDINVPKTKELLGKVSSTAEYLGGDHDLVHDIFKLLEKNPNSRISKIDQIIKSKAFETMDPKKAALLIKEQVNVMETIAGNVLQFRYDEIAKLYKKSFELGKLKKLGYNSKTFSGLNEVSKQKFIKRFSNQVAVGGGLDLEKYFKNIDNALVPLKEHNLKNLSEAFGFTTQTYSFK